MDEILTQFKKMVYEPRVYAIIVKSAYSQVLHLGIHFSLEEAYTVARQKMESLAPHKPGDAMDIDLWNSMPAREVVVQLMDPNKVNLVPKEPPPVETPVDHTVTKQNQPPIPTTPISALPPAFQAVVNNLFQAGEKKPINDIIRPRDSRNLEGYINDSKRAKNELMKKLIQDGNRDQVEKLKGSLTAYERRYLLKNIKKVEKVEKVGLDSNMEISKIETQDEKGSNQIVN